MSWDILIINSEKPVVFENDYWPDFSSREEIINGITAIFPEIKWTENSWGDLENESADIEFNLGDSDNVGNNFMLHIRGVKNPVEQIFKICDHNYWSAFDLNSEKFIDHNLEKTGFNKWKEYRDEIILKEKNKNIGGIFKFNLLVTAGI